MVKKIVSIVLPCFNEAVVLPKTMARIKKLCQDFIKKGFLYEIIMVDDGSDDQTKNIITSYCQKDKNIILVSFSRNFGHEAASLAGIKIASGDAVVLMDADLQDPPEVVLDMIKKWQGGADVVYGVRQNRKGESLFKKINAFFFYRLINLLANRKIPADTGDFRLMDRKVVTALQQMPERTKFLRGMIAWLGFQQTAVYFVRDKRAGGKTKYPFKKLLSLAMDGIFSFSIKPLQWTTYLGFSISLLSLLGIIYNIYKKLFTDAYVISGFATTIIAILFLGGVQLIVLGILGEYVGRIYSEVKHRPEYVIDEIIGGKKTHGKK
ncbi:MAG: glycosyltransferase family 2 protein [Alphaproteobacteria bacterium]